MPYTHRKEGNKNCVYKKDGGAKVGCTKGDVKKYLAALHANANESVTESNTLKGGKADKMSIEDIAKKFNTSVDKIKAQIQKGVKVEMEHTSDKEKASEIATDHVSEFPDYYDRLDKMEGKAKKDWEKINENNKTLIKNLLSQKLLFEIKNQIQEDDRREYLNWKRKNITLRGVSNSADENGYNGAGASFGDGLYTAFLSNKSLAKGYGKVYYVLNAVPKHPKIVDSWNHAEIFTQNVVNNWCKKNGLSYKPHEFYSKTNLKDEMISLGYDGLIIKGREMVNYTPPDNIVYFKNDDELYRYFKTININ
jgi:hypothetical protein